MNRWSESEFILVHMYYMYYVHFDNVDCFIYEYWILIRNIKEKNVIFIQIDSNHIIQRIGYGSLYLLTKFDEQINA